MKLNASVRSYFSFGSGYYFSRLFVLHESDRRKPGM